MLETCPKNLAGVSEIPSVISYYYSYCFFYSIIKQFWDAKKRNKDFCSLLSFKHFVYYSACYLQLLSRFVTFILKKYQASHLAGVSGPSLIICLLLFLLFT